MEYLFIMEALEIMLISIPMNVIPDDKHHHIDSYIVKCIELKTLYL